MQKFLYTVHSKLRGTVEVRVFVQIPTHYHRLGTMNMHEQAWRAMRQMLLDSDPRLLTVVLNEDKWTPLGPTLDRPSLPEIPR